MFIGCVQPHASGYNNIPSVFAQDMRILVTFIVRPETYRFPFFPQDEKYLNYRIMDFHCGNYREL